MGAFVLASESAQIQGSGHAHARYTAGRRPPVRVILRASIKRHAWSPALERADQPRHAESNATGPNPAPEVSQHCRIGEGRPAQRQPHRQTQTMASTCTAVARGGHPQAGSLAQRRPQRDGAAWAGARYPARSPSGRPPAGSCMRTCAFGSR